MVDDHDEAMGYRPDGFLLASSAGDPMIVRVQVRAARTGNADRNLSQNRSQPHISLGRRSAEPFASTLPIAWTDARPGGQMLGGGEARHIGPDLRHQNRRSD